MSGVVEDIFDTFVMFILKEFPEEISEALRLLRHPPAATKSSETFIHVILSW